MFPDWPTALAASIPLGTPADVLRRAEAAYRPGMLVELRRQSVILWTPEDRMTGRGYTLPGPGVVGVFTPYDKVGNAGTVPAADTAVDVSAVPAVDTEPGHGYPEEDVYDEPSVPAVVAPAAPAVKAAKPRGGKRKPDAAAGNVLSLFPGMGA